MTRDQFVKFVEGCKKTPLDLGFFNLKGAIGIHADKINKQHGMPDGGVMFHSWQTGQRTGQEYLQVEMHFGDIKTYMHFVDQRTPTDNHEFAGACVYLGTKLLSAWYWEKFNNENNGDRL